MRNLITILFFISGSIVLSGQNIIVEPPYWWVGMKDPSLQLMIRGESIGSSTVSIEGKQIELIKTTKAKSPNYIFLDLKIKPDAEPGVFQITLKNESGSAHSINYTLQERKPDSSERQGFTTSDAIYLITPDRFANGNPGNDNLPDLQDKSNRSESLGRHGGDIQGIIQHLDYISEMGFSALWLNPVLENKMPRHSYHGYAITDFYKVDPRFGTNEDYKLLCDKASGRNIKVIMDMVVNHCGLHHWWMKDPPTDDWINFQNEEYQQTNHRKTLSTDPYAAPGDKKQLFEGWFVRTMPDMNVMNPLMGAYLIQNSIWWIEYAGLSGIRMDTYPYPDEDYMARWSARIMHEYPHFNIVGEIWYDDPGIISYWQKGKENANGYNSSLPSLCDFPLQAALNKSLNANGGWEDSWTSLYETMAKDYQYADPMSMMVFADNHDMSRIYTQVEEDYSRFVMAMAYILTTRGIPQIYYGTEVLMSNPGTDNHGVIRSDFPGGWSGDQVNAFTGEGMSSSQREAQTFLRKLLNWRKTAEVIHNGKMIHYTPENNVYVFFRYNDRQTVMVVLNRNDKPVSLDLERFRTMLGDCASGTDVITGELIPLVKSIDFRIPGVMVIEAAR